MKYAVSNWIYGGEPLAVTFERLHRLGCHGVEIQAEPERQDPREVRALADRYQLDVCSVAGAFPWPTEERDLAHPDPEVRSRAVRFVQSLVEFAAVAGAPQVLFVPAAVPRRAPVGYAGDPETWWPLVEREWSLAVASVREAAEFAAARGVRLTVEPINRYESFLLNTAEQALRFVEEVGSPWVGVHLDTFHMNMEEPDPAAAVRRVGARLTSLHVSDSHRGPPGEGHVDFRGILQSLQEIGFQGYLILEPLAAVADVDVAVRASRYVALRDSYAERGLAWLRALESRLHGQRG